uniref:Apple domain-containing protein n=1 Tax=Romanomermis culicivorax TaxID=13658 RepID=A0A915KA20_ROMCU
METKSRSAAECVFACYERLQFCNSVKYDPKDFSCYFSYYQHSDCNQSVGLIKIKPFSEDQAMQNSLAIHQWPVLYSCIKCLPVDNAKEVEMFENGKDLTRSNDFPERHLIVRRSNNEAGSFKIGKHINVTKFDVNQTTSNFLPECPKHVVYSTRATMMRSKSPTYVVASGVPNLQECADLCYRQNYCLSAIYHDNECSLSLEKGSCSKALLPEYYDEAIFISCIKCADIILVGMCLFSQVRQDTGQCRDLGGVDWIFAVESSWFKGVRHCDPEATRHTYTKTIWLIDFMMKELNRTLDISRGHRVGAYFMDKEFRTISPLCVKKSQPFQELKFPTAQELKLHDNWEDPYTFLNLANKIDQEIKNCERPPNKQCLNNGDSDFIKSLLGEWRKEGIRVFLITVNHCSLNFLNRGFRPTGYYDKVLGYMAANSYTNVIDHVVPVIAPFILRCSCRRGDKCLTEETKTTQCRFHDKGGEEYCTRDVNWKILTQPDGKFCMPTWQKQNCTGDHCRVQELKVPAKIGISGTTIADDDDSLVTGDNVETIALTTVTRVVSTTTTAVPVFNFYGLSITALVAIGAGLVLILAILCCTVCLVKSAKRRKAARIKIVFGGAKQPSSQSQYSAGGAGARQQGSFMSGQSSSGMKKMSSLSPHTSQLLQKSSTPPGTGRSVVVGTSMATGRRVSITQPKSKFGRGTYLMPSFRPGGSVSQNQQQAGESLNGKKLSLPRKPYRTLKVKNPPASSSKMTSYKGSRVDAPNN